MFNRSPQPLLDQDQRNLTICCQGPTKKTLVHETTIWQSMSFGPTSMVLWMALGPTILDFPNSPWAQHSFYSLVHWLPTPDLELHNYLNILSFTIIWPLGWWKETGCDQIPVLLSWSKRIFSHLQNLTLRKSLSIGMDLNSGAFFSWKTKRKPAFSRRIMTDNFVKLIR